MRKKKKEGCCRVVLLTPFSFFFAVCGLHTLLFFFALNRTKVFLFLFFFVEDSLKWFQLQGLFIIIVLILCGGEGGREGGGSGKERGRKKKDAQFAPPLPFSCWLLLTCFSCF